MNEVKITVPEGFEIDKENSTFECIKFKPKKDYTIGEIVIARNINNEFLGIGRVSDIKGNAVTFSGFLYNSGTYARNIVLISPNFNKATIGYSEVYESMENNMKFLLNKDE